MDREIIRTLSYFARFGYPPTFGELHTFLSAKTNRDILLKNLTLLKRRNIVKFLESSDKRDFRISISDNTRAQKYHTGGGYQYKNKNEKIKNKKYNLKIKKYPERERYSQEKIRKAKRFITALAMFPQIKLVGLSGSVAMLNAEKAADIDLFVITAKDRLWTGRLVCLMLAQLFGMRRVYGQNKAKDLICPNLFFDESGMGVPAAKKTEYVAHEILQMKPLVNKNGAYERFIAANSWIKRLFPNAKMPVLSRKYYVLSARQIRFPLNAYYLMLNILSGIIEKLVRSVQLRSINHHRTTEIISDRQLWFFPDDFEKRVL